MYLSESLADVKQRWSGNRVSEVGGREQQRRHFKVDKLKNTKNKTYRKSFCHLQKKENVLCLFMPWVLPLRLHTGRSTFLLEVVGSEKRTTGTNQDLNKQFSILCMFFR